MDAFLEGSVGDLLRGQADAFVDDFEAGGIIPSGDRNVSETARRLNMHRRTLQRILNKYAPREREK